MQWVDKPRGAQQLAERVVHSILQIRFGFEGKNLRLTASVGIALYPKHCSSVEKLVADADAAIFRVKTTGKQGWWSYLTDLDRAILIGKMSWHEPINYALKNHFFVAFLEILYWWLQIASERNTAPVV
ncbi:MAG: diguanylate cyclase [Sedimenticolaceae bacterium]